MVDPVSGSGQVQNILNQRQQQQETNNQRESEEARQNERRDEVRISEDAISLQQAEEAARQIREELEADESLTLGLDPDFDREDV